MSSSKPSMFHNPYPVLTDLELEQIRTAYYYDCYKRQLVAQKWWMHQGMLIAGSIGFALGAAICFAIIGF